MTTGSITDELIIGPGRVFLAPASPALVLPTHDDIDALIAGTFAGFDYLGDTTTAVTVSDEPEVVYAESQQGGREIDGSVKKMKTSFKSEARGFTVKRIAQWINGSYASSSSTGGSQVATLTPGGVGPLKKFAVAVVGPWTDGRQTSALVIAERCIYGKGLEWAMDADNYAKTPFELHVLRAFDPTHQDWTVFLPADAA